MRLPRPPLAQTFICLSTGIKGKTNWKYSAKGVNFNTARRGWRCCCCCCFFIFDMKLSNFNNSHKWIKCSLFVYEAGALALSHIEQQSRSMKWTMQRKVNLQFTLKYWIHLLSNGVLIRTPGLFQLTRYHLKVFSEELQQYSNYLKYLKRTAVYVSVCPNHNKCLQTCSWSTTRPKIHYS